MKNYLSLAGIQAKAHKKQNVMTIFCIVLAVFLIAGVFTMADVAVKQQMDRMIIKHGNWHISVSGITEEETETIKTRSDVMSASRVDDLNFNLDEEYRLGEKKAAIIGADDSYQQIMEMINEGSYPEGEGQIAVSDNMKERMNLQTGDRVVLSTPNGEREYIISGFCSHTLMLSDNDACGVMLDTDAYRQLAEDNGVPYRPILYIRFKDGNVRGSIDRIVEEQGWSADRVSENTGVLGLMGASTSNYVVGLYGVAAVLMILVVAAGILMISGSMNTNISQRTGYFGMLRCIGTSRRQVKRLVLLEALNWCKTAVPVGLVSATVSTWVICLAMRYGIGGEWSDMPVFHVSISALALGTVIGILTVILAALSPARRASLVTPIEAVSGNRNASVKQSVTGTKTMKIERALGINHAVSGKKTLLLITGSFALSIVIFLSFSVMIDWVQHALNTNEPYTPDLSLYYENYEAVIPTDLAIEVSDLSGVKKVYGRMYESADVSTDKDVSVIDLISYEDNQFKWSEADLLEGNIDRVQNGSGYVMTVFEKRNPLSMGDELTVHGKL